MEDVNNLTTKLQNLLDLGQPSAHEDLRARAAMLTIDFPEDDTISTTTKAEAFSLWSKEINQLLQRLFNSFVQDRREIDQLTLHSRQLQNEIDHLRDPARQGAPSTSAAESNAPPKQIHDPVLAKLREFRKSKRERSDEEIKMSPALRYQKMAQFTGNAPELKEWMELETKKLQNTAAKKLFEEIQNSNEIKITGTLLDQLQSFTSVETGGFLASRSAMESIKKITSMPRFLSQVFLPAGIHFNSGREMHHLSPDLTSRFEAEDSWFHESLVPNVPASLGFLKGALKRGLVEGILRGCQRINFASYQRALVLLQYIWADKLNRDNPSLNEPSWITEVEAVDLVAELFWSTLHLHQHLSKQRFLNQLQGGEYKSFKGAQNFIKSQGPQFSFAPKDELKTIPDRKKPHNTRDQSKDRKQNNSGGGKKK